MRIETTHNFLSFISFR